MVDVVEFSKKEKEPENYEDTKKIMKDILDELRGKRESDHRPDLKLIRFDNPA